MPTQSPLIRRGLTLTLTLTLTLLNACAASSTPVTRQPTHDRVIVTSDPAGTVADVSLVREDRVGSYLVAGSGERLWQRLPAAYQALGLPAPAADQSRLAVAVQDHPITRRLGDARLSDLFDCGSDMSGQVADTHRLRVTIETWLEPAGGSTMVHTRAQGAAYSTERSGRISCASTGVLERRIADTLAGDPAR